VRLCEDCSADVRYCGHQIPEQCGPACLAPEPTDTHALYREAIEADRLFSEALVTYYGAKAAPMARYMVSHADPVVSSRMSAMLEATEAYRKACRGSCDAVIRMTGAGMHERDITCGKEATHTDGIGFSCEEHAGIGYRTLRAKVP
jgi:hypothetical protein